MPDAQTRLEDLLFRSYWDDGILDLLCGIALIFFGFTLFFGVAYLIGVSLIPPFTCTLRCIARSSNRGPALSNSRVDESAGMWGAWPSPTSSSQPCS